MSAATTRDPSTATAGLSGAAVPSPRAAQLYEEARRYLPGGVSAAARFDLALGRPFFAARGEGAHVWDVDGREFVDMHMSYGAALLGHGHPAIKKAVADAVESGILCGFETPFQTEVARKIVEAVPCAEMVRFTGSGTETVWHALRTARVFTGRLKVVKFEGHFHGYSDQLGYSFWPSLDEAGPAEAPFVIPESGGVTPADAAEVLVLPWNDLAAFERCLAEHPGQIAAVIMEPINHNSGTILPAPGYLEAVRELTQRDGIVLIFDEILSGFRTGPSCAQGLLNVTPDLCTIGKCIAGGMPLSAFMGRRDVMESVAPLGKAVHSGTFNAHPVAVRAASAFFDVIREPEFWTRLLANADYFYERLREVFARAGLVVQVQGVGTQFGLLFGLDRAPRNYRDIARCDRAKEIEFYRAANREGVYFGYAWHHGFSAAHTRPVLDDALDRIEHAVRGMTDS
jgi:glutamate-1-semialdehyde 2,1-aminomutase